jgi:hypothetical protein
MKRLSQCANEVDFIAALCAIAAAGMCFLLRWGTQNEGVDQLWKFMGLSLFMICGPSVLNSFVSSVSRSLASLGLSLTVVLCGSFSEPTCRIVGCILAVLGALALLWCIMTHLLSGSRFFCLSRALLLGVCCVFLLPLFAWQSGDGDPLLVYSLLNGTFPLHDHVFHSAIAAMVQSHGVCSSGLDGVVYVPYHCGSHFAGAMISNLAGCLPLDYYSVGYPIVVLPFCLWVTLEFVRVFAGIYQPEKPRDRISFLGYLVLFVGFSGFLYDILWSEFHSRWDLYIRASESQMVGVTVLLLVASAFIHPFQSAFLTKDSISVTRWKCGFILLFWAAFVWIITITKTSNGHLLFVAVAVAAAFAVRSQGLLICASFVCGAVVTLVTVFMITGGESGLVVAPFVFAKKSFFSKDWWQYWFLALLPLSTFLWLRLRLAGVRTFSDCLVILRQRRCLDVWLMLVLFAASIVPCMLFTGVNASNTIYYQGCVQVILVCLVAALMNDVASENLTKPRLITLSNVALIAFCIALAAGAFERVGRQCLAIAKANISSRGSVFMTPFGDASVAGKPSFRELLLAGEVLKSVRLLGANTEATEQLFQEGRGAVIRELQNLGRQPKLERRQIALWIPKDNRDFWDVSTENRWRPFIPVLAVALSGLPLIDGYPELNEERGYGFGVYPHRFKTRAESSSREEVIQRATALGFSELVELRPGGDVTYHRLRDKAADSQ